MTNRLTLDYGIRWDEENEGHEIHERNSMFGPPSPTPPPAAFSAARCMRATVPAAATASSPDPTILPSGPALDSPTRSIPKP